MKRMLIAGGVVVVLLVAVVFVLRSETEVTTEATDRPSPLAKLDTEEVTKLVLSHHLGKGDDRHKQEVVLLRTSDGGAKAPDGGAAEEDATWTLAEPAEAAASQSSITTLMKRLGELELRDVASEQASSHEDLEVDEEGGIFVEVYAGDSRLASFVVGKYISGNTMVRLADSEVVWRASGSLRYVFGKRAADWREKKIYDFDRAKVAHVEFHNEQGDFIFDFRTPEGEGEEAEAAWAITSVDALAPPDPSADDEGEDAPEAVPTKRVSTIDGYDANRVKSLITSIARLRCTDFLDETEGVETGLEPESAARVVFAVGSGEKAASYTLLIGANRDERSVYARRADVDQVYVISKSLANRLRPGVSQLSRRASEATKAARAGGGPGGGPGGKIPPDVLRAAKQEMQRQQLLKQLTSKAGR